MFAASGSPGRAVSKETETLVAGWAPSSPVQWPAVSTTVGEMRVPEQRNRPSDVVNRMTPTLVWTVSRCPSVIAEADCALARNPVTSNRPVSTTPAGPNIYRFIEERPPVDGRGSPPRRADGGNGPGSDPSRHGVTDCGMLEWKGLSAYAKAEDRLPPPHRTATMRAARVYGSNLGRSLGPAELGCRSFRRQWDS